MTSVNIIHSFWIFLFYTRRCTTTLCKTSELGRLELNRTFLIKSIFFNKKLIKYFYAYPSLNTIIEGRVWEKKNPSRLMTKPTKWHVRPAKTQISLGIRPVWSESSLYAWRKLRSLATQWEHSEDSDQTGWMPRLIWVFFAERTVILLVLSWGGSSIIIVVWCKLKILSLMITVWHHLACLKMPKLPLWRNFQSAPIIIIYSQWMIILLHQ